MKTVFFALIACLFFACSNSEDENADNEQGQISNLPKDEASPLPETKALQNSIKQLKIASAICYMKKLEGNDSFKLHEIRDYDENGRLVGIYSVNSTNTDTSVRETFVYNNNGLLKQTHIKTLNSGEMNEFFIYSKDGQPKGSYLISNMEMVGSYTDTFQFKRGGDTLYKFKIENAQIMLDRPDIQIFNKKGQITKEVKRFPMYTPVEIVAKTYKHNFPLPVKEIYSRSIIYPMEYKIEYRFR